MSSSNAELRKQLIEVFDRCLAMQARHLNDMQSGSLTKIDRWIEERQAMIVGLRQALADNHSPGLDPDLRALLLEKLSCIISTEEVLFALARQQRYALSDQLAIIRRGKRTLGRYGQTIKNHHPQFVSDNG